MATPAGGKGLDTTFTAYKVPLSAVLKWPAGNFTHPERRRWLIPYSITLYVLATLIVGARLWTRMNRQAGGFGWDDSLIIFAWLAAGGVTGLGAYGVRSGGLDRHVWDLHPDECTRSGLVAWATEIMFLTSLCLTKISVLLFFRRLIDRSHSPWISKAIWGAIAFTVAYFLAFFFFLVFACDPVNAAWKSLNITWTGKYQCTDRHIVDPLNGVFSVFSDAYSMIIPILIVSRLTMPGNRKVVLHIIFCCGLIVLGAGVARTIWLARLFTDSRRDLTWVGYDLLVWGVLEMEMAIICASAPAMKGFFSGLSKTVTNRYGSKTRNTDHSNSFPLSSKISPPRTGSGTADLIQRDGQFITLHEGTLRGDEYLHAQDPWLQQDPKYHDGHKYTEEPKYSEEPYYRGKWADSDLHSQTEPWNEGKTSQEILTVPGRRARVQDGGILITETFSVERASDRDPYAKERRVLGI